MWVTTFKCCAVNTTDLRSIDLQVWSTLTLSLYRGKELWSGHSAAAYTGFLRNVYRLQTSYWWRNHSRTLCIVHKWPRSKLRRVISCLTSIPSSSASKERLYWVVPPRFSALTSCYSLFAILNATHTIVPQFQMWVIIYSNQMTIIIWRKPVVG